LKTDEAKKNALAKPKQVKWQLCKNFLKLDNKQSKENSAKSLVDALANPATHVETIRKIKVLLRTAPDSWWQDFVAASGIAKLSDTLAKDHGANTETEAVQALKILCIGKVCSCVVFYYIKIFV